ncbi:MAG: hypothetical protein QM483_04875 [Desulfuromusa sp.]
MKLWIVFFGVLIVVSLSGCATQVTKSSLEMAFLSSDFSTLFEEEEDNGWRDCFDTDKKEMDSDFEVSMKECTSKELESKPDFFTASEVEAVTAGIALCTQIKLWQKHKDEFSLDKNIDNKKKLKFCTKFRDSLKKYK